MSAKDAATAARKIIKRWLDPSDRKTHDDWLQVSNWCHGAYRLADSLGHQSASQLFEEAGGEALDCARKVREATS